MPETVLQLDHSSYDAIAGFQPHLNFHPTQTDVLV